MTRRPGLTMTEALVAIFITAIGLVGVMSMFPFGAKQMSDALISDRSASHAGAIDGLVRSYWKDKVVEFSGNGEPFWNAMDNPGGGLPVAQETSPEISYPVFLDPLGVVGRGGSNKDWVGDVGQLTSVPRRNMNLITSGGSPLALRLWSQPDGFSWDDDSRPMTGSVDMRELRYNALAVLQRPINRDRYTATLKVVVFINRRAAFFPPGSEAKFDNISFAPGSTAIAIPSTADIKKGSWIMDATVQAPPTIPNPPYIRHANFYRVVSVAENTTGTYDVELHTPIKRVDGGTNSYTGTVVVVAGAADVFERPVLTGNTNP